MTPEDIGLAAWVSVKPEYDVDPIFRPDGKPTTGRVNLIERDGVTGEIAVHIHVPIGDADVDEHSQLVLYAAHMLNPAQAPA